MNLHKFLQLLIHKLLIYRKKKKIFFWNVAKTVALIRNFIISLFTWNHRIYVRMMYVWIKNNWIGMLKVHSKNHCLSSFCIFNLMVLTIIGGSIKLPLIKQNRIKLLLLYFTYKFIHFSVVLLYFLNAKNILWEQIYVWSMIITG